MSGNRVQSRRRQAFHGLVMLVILAFVAALPFSVGLPEPSGALKLAEARVELEGVSQEITLPHSWPRTTASGPAVAHYDLVFDLSSKPQAGLTLFVPAIRQHHTIAVNGAELVVGKDSHWTNPVLGTSVVATVPAAVLLPGRNEIEVRLERATGNIPGHLSPVFLGSAQAITSGELFWAELPGYMRSVSYALLVLVLAGVIIVWSARPYDAIFGWLAAAAGFNLFVALAETGSLGAWASFIQPYLFTIYGIFGVLAAGISLALVDRPRPRWLVWAGLGIPVIGAGTVALGLVPLLVAALTSVSLALAGHLAAVLVLVRDFMRYGRWETGLLAIPFFLTIAFGLHDIAVTVGIVESGFLMSSYVRSLVVLCIIIILMRRLAVSLDLLDRANETLHAKLSEREAELSLLHAKEQQRTVERVRDEERQRLMRDLHDGVSGHLISIIALAEQGPGEAKAIEKAARDALDDLRLVVNSLDIGDRDLPLALAAFRERIRRQLRRMGVELSWSMDRLPEVSGLTPSSALSILRILQEAVTNALKHGPATHIAIAGTEGSDGTAHITVDNDGCPANESGKGYGLGNMRHRAGELGGSAELASHGDGARLTLILPRALNTAAPA